MAVLNNSALVGAAGKGGGAAALPQRSLRFNSADTSLLSRNFPSSGDRKKWTWSGWVKRSKLGVDQALFSAPQGGGYPSGGIIFNSSDQLRLFSNDASSNIITNKITSAVYRDISAWMHIVVAADFANTQAKLYVNGVEITNFSTNINPTNTDGPINSGGIVHTIGQFSNTFYLDGYLANIHFIDGQALTPSAFAYTDPVTGRWEPKTYAGSYSGNSFYLDFSDNSAATATALGADRSGLGNNWVPNNISVGAGSGNDSLRDHPVSAGIDGGLGGQISGNFATLNPLAKANNHALSNGNLDLTPSGHGTTTATIAVTAGMKVYMEFVRTGGTDGGGWGFTTSTTPYQAYPGTAAGLWWIYDNGGNFGYNDQTTMYEYGSKATTGQTLQLAIDYSAGKAWIGINNSWFTNANTATGNPSTGANPTFTFSTSLPIFPLVESAGWTVSCNFGQRQWNYAAPTGFTALCDQNMPTPPIIKPANYFDITTWVGTSDTNSTRSFSPFSFSPDFVWIKDRKDANQHTLYDVLRGPSNGTTSKALMTNSQNAEGTLNDDSTYGYLSSFDANGFSVWRGTDGAYVDRNTNGYVAWAWDAGGQPTTDNVAGAGNVPTAGSAKINGANMTTALAGSIPATRLSANTAAGFSVVSWTGGTAGTVGHGLNAAPGLVITKSRTSTVAWRIWHSSFSSLANYIGFDTGSTGTFPNGNYWQAFTSSTIGFTGGYDNNTGSMIAYCFAPVAGYSAFGVYSGGTVGTFVHLGFTPKFLLVHSATGSIGDAWKAYDSTRSSYNARADFIAPNAADAEVPNNLNQFDFVSNGFVVRSNTIYDTNFANHTYLYCAFAESPFRYSRAR